MSTRYTPAVTPPRAEPRALKYRPADEHLLRRLGSAIVMHWDTLPDTLQDLLIDQAAVTDDREEGAHAQSDIETFIRGVKVIQIAKAQEAKPA